MCARYNFLAGETREMLAIVREIERRWGRDAWKQGDIRPTDRAPILVETSSGVESRLPTWGFRTPRTLVINARSETAARLPLFRDCLRTGRCVIPSSGFYEWDGDRHRYLFRLPGEEVLYMAGLCRLQEGGLSFCILTAQANASMREVHDRMPLVLRRSQIRPWLSPHRVPEEVLQLEPPELERTCLDPQLSLW